VRVYQFRHIRAARELYPPVKGPLVPLTVVFLEYREILEVALDAGHEIFVPLPAHDPELALAARPPSAGASLDSQPGREPGPFRADEDEEGADE
jgi:hypothetical protein